MGKIISGLASSHAYALQEPAQWDMMRQRTMERYKARFGKYPPLQARIAEETSDLREQRYQRIRSGLEFLKLKIAEQKPDALILVGDDQDEILPKTICRRSRSTPAATFLWEKSVRW